MKLSCWKKRPTAFLFGERGKFPPRGVVGGGSGALNKFSFQQTDGDHTPPLVSKMIGINLAQGQRLRLETPGGGGYGAPFDRPPERVAKDVAKGFVSVGAARRDYGVCLAPGGSVDANATRAYRRSKVPA